MAKNKNNNRKIIFNTTEKQSINKTTSKKVEKIFFSYAKSSIFATSKQEKEVFETLRNADVTQLVE